MGPCRAMPLHESSSTAPNARRTSSIRIMRESRLCINLSRRFSIASIRECMSSRMPSSCRILKKWAVHLLSVDLSNERSEIQKLTLFHLHFHAVLLTLYWRSMEKKHKETCCYYRQFVLLLRQKARVHDNGSHPAESFVLE